MAQCPYSNSNANCGAVEGTVAFVRALPDATLAVTLFDNGKLYSLLPNPVGLEKTNTCCHNQTSKIAYQNSDLNCNQHPGVKCNLHSSSAQATDFNKPGTVSKSSETDGAIFNTAHTTYCNNGAQAVDGRYISTYQVSHCKATPTSPPQLLSEFPPQRLEPETVTFVKNTHPASNSWNGDLKYCTNFVTNTYRQGVVAPEQERHLRNSDSQRNKERGKTKGELSNSLPSLENSAFDLSKKIQTYTRSANHNRKRTEDIDKEIHSPEREIRSDVIYKDSQSNTAFDTMKRAKRKRPSWMDKGIFHKDMDVRHLTDVTKCIRESIRFFCSEDPQPTESNDCERGSCPQLAERYMRHQRVCSGLIQPKPNGVDTEVQAAARKCEKEVSTTSCNRRPEPLKFCISIPRFCQCKTLKSQSLPCPKCRTTNMLNAKIRREIQNWHAKVPVSAHESQEDKCRRYKILEALAERVIEIADILEGEELKIHLQKDLKKFVRDIPMWSPGSKCCDDSLKDKMLNSLVEHLYEIIHKKSSILDETISDWLKDIPITKANEQNFNKENLQKELKECITTISTSRPSCDAHFKNALKQGIKDTLEKRLSNFDGFCNKNEILTNMSGQLADLVKDLTPANKGSEQYEIEIKIRDCIEKTPELAKNEISQDAINALSSSLVGILHGGNPRSDEIQDEIIEWLSLHTTKLPDQQTISRFTEKFLPVATSTLCESYDNTINSNYKSDCGTLADSVQNILNKSGLPIRPEVRKKLALDIVNILVASTEEMCARNDESLNIIQSLLQNESHASEEQTSRIAHEILILAEVHAEMNQMTHDSSSSSPRSEKKLCFTVTGNSKRDSHCDQSFREQLEESIHEVFEEQNIHPNNENEAIENLVAIMESIDVGCGESCFERSFQRKVVPEVSKLLSQCSSCPPNKAKLNTTIEELKARFGEIKNRYKDAEPSNDEPNEKSVQETRSLKIKISEWADELPLKSETKAEVKKVKDNMVTELSEEIAQLQKQQEREKKTSRYHERVREKVTRWLKKLPLQTEGLTNSEEMADDLMKRITMTSEFIETCGEPNQAQLENTVMNWFKNSSFYRQITAEERRRQIQLVPQLANELKEIQASFLNTSLDDPVVSNKVRAKIIDFLKNLPIVNEKLRNEKAYQESANELLNQMIYGDNSALNNTIMNENEVFENIVSEWITNLPLPERLEFEEVQKHNDLKDKFIKQISHMRENPDKFSENAMRGEIIRLMSMFPIADNKKRDRRFIYSQASDLIDRLRAVPYNPEPKTNFNKYLALLKREIVIWIDEFPVGYADVEGDETHKNNAAGQLAEKIFMVQMRHPNESDQEVYEEELYEIINRWLTALNRPKIDANKHRLTVRLIMRINDLESRMANAVMQIVPLKPYKERYLENIAAGAVPLRFINKEEEKMHQEIVHNMANAFINRNYKLEDPEQKTELLEALCTHIRDFLDYVETLPDEQPNYEALRAELEEVLKQVPVPDIEKARNEKKIKQTWKVVTAWYKSLPVDAAADPEEEMDRVRMLNYLNIKMAKIRKDLNVSSHEEGNWDERMLKEIFNFLGTLPLHRNDCAALDEFADSLITAYLDAERSLLRTLSSKAGVTNSFHEQLPERHFELGGPCGKKKEGRRSKKPIPQKELHDKHIIEQPSDPSLLNRTADQIHFQRPKESIDKKFFTSAPPEGPVSCKTRTSTPRASVPGRFESYYDPEYVDERFLDDSLENYQSFKEKAQFSSSILPARDQPSKKTGSCKVCSKPGGQTSKATQSPQTPTNTSKTPQSPKQSQYHKTCLHPTEDEEQTASKSPKSGRHPTKSIDASIRQRTPSPAAKADFERSGVTGISLKIKSPDGKQSNRSQFSVTSPEEHANGLPAHYTSQVSESDRYRLGPTRFREHYDGPQSVPARTADRAISPTLQREIDLARQIGMYEEPPTGDAGQRMYSGNQRGSGFARDRRQGPCIRMDTQDGQRLPTGTEDDVPVYCPCIQKMLNCRSFGFLFRPSCPSIPTDDPTHHCPHCCNMCPCPDLAHFQPPPP